MEVMYSSLFVCLLICLLAGLLEKLWTDVEEIRILDPEYEFI